MDLMYAQVEQARAVQDYPPHRPCVRLVRVEEPSFRTAAFDGGGFHSRGLIAREHAGQTLVARNVLRLGHAHASHTQSLRCDVREIYLIDRTRPSGAVAPN